MECQSVSSGFYLKYGFVVSNFYELVDEQNIDINHDGIDDSIAIISPRNLLLPSIYPFCHNEKKGDRILLVWSADFVSSYKNVIRNEMGIATLGIEQIEKSSSGFNLSYRKGQSCSGQIQVAPEKYRRVLF